MENIREIISELKKPFPASDHKERKLPGGDRWFYLPWQLIRERLDDVYPEWEIFYGDPVYVGDATNDKTHLCSIRCGIKLGNLTRWGVGNAHVVLLSSAGNDMSRGTPVERARADAFKNAAEEWGIGRYIDDQTEVTRILQKSMDGRAIAFAAKNQTQYTKKTGEISRQEWLKRKSPN